MFVSEDLQVNAQGHLTIGGQDTVELAKQYGTPLYLLDEDYIDSGYNEEYIKNLLIRLSNLGSKIVVLTGVSFDDNSQGVMSYNRETGEFSSYFNENIPGYFHSTGDIFSSTLCGALVKGFDMGKAVRIAVDFTVDCIKHTLGSEKEHWYAVKFEECIPDLIEMIK